ncbi:MAG: type II toxin-antitoxin system VapC family toxin [Candidatus Azobacteroides sp.]|nr:type II toxin-antitoxin system VapC family toxin [Candidatus Azobacteroides sp.]
MILCDTNIFIEVYRNNPEIENKLMNIGINNLAISDVTKAELLIGAKNKVELSAIRKHLKTLLTLHITSEISELAVDLVDEYCLSHKLLLPDALIAATAIHYNIELFTLNLKDFKFIPNIKLKLY